MSPRVESQLKSLPAKPGVYLFRDEDGEVLYVGKAKTLRSRVNITRGYSSSIVTAM